MNASDLYKDGRLREAIEAQIQEVKASAIDHVEAAVPLRAALLRWRSGAARRPDRGHRIQGS